LTPPVIAFVHAKGTSDRVHRKNLRRLGDRPLFCHAIANARAARNVDLVVIDSEDDEILALGAHAGAQPLKRPADLADNRTSGDQLAYWQASSFPGSTYVVQVIPTSPFLRPASIDRAIDMLRQGDADSVVGVFSDVQYTWRNNRPTYYRPDGSLPNSSEMEPTLYETTGLYANRTDAVLRTRRRMNPDRALPLVVSRLEALDVNTPEDFDMAEIVWRGLGGRS
jgi:CMP-N-acetylneuraminic acid synthetase